MEIIYRKATKKDAKTIESLFTQMLFTIYKNPAIKQYKKGYLDRFFTALKDCIFVAELNNVVVGYISINVFNDNLRYLYIDDFCVDKDFRNKGIGTKLLSMVENYAKEIGIGDICLHVEKTNVLAKNLYDRNGYSVFKVERTKVLMNKIILKK